MIRSMAAGHSAATSDPNTPLTNPCLPLTATTMSKFVRGSLTGVIVAAAASYSFSEAIGARTDDLTKECVLLSSEYPL